MVLLLCAAMLFLDGAAFDELGGDDVALDFVGAFADDQ